MKRWIAGLVLITVTHSASALSIGEYLRQRDSSNTASFKLTQIYLTGVVSGYIWANANNAAKKIPLLFCQPPPVTANIEIVKMLDEELGQINVTDDYPAELVLLQALVRAYPCDSMPDSQLR